MSKHRVWLLRGHLQDRSFLYHRPFVTSTSTYEPRIGDDLSPGSDLPRAKTHSEVALTLHHLEVRDEPELRMRKHPPTIAAYEGLVVRPVGRQPPLGERPDKGELLSTVENVSSSAGQSSQVR